MKEIKLAILPLNIVIDANWLSIRSFQMRFVLVYNVIIGYREKCCNCEKYENENSLSHIFIFIIRKRTVYRMFLEFSNLIFFRKPVKMTGIFRAHQTSFSFFAVIGTRFFAFFLENLTPNARYDTHIGQTG